MRTPKVVGLALMLSVASGLGAEGELWLRAGFATADLTPPLGVELAGFGYNLGRTADAVRDRLLARAVVVELGGKRAAIVGCDLGGIALRITEKVRARVETETGIPASSVMVSTTHTHSAPNVANWIGVREPDTRYLAEVPEKIARAIIDASKNLEPVSVAYGEAPVTEVARNREYKDGPIDKNARVLKFTKASGEIAGFIVNYSVHPVVMANLTRMVTGDLTGVAVDKVAGEHRGAVGIFLQGSCGDINPIYAHMPQDESLQKLDLLAARLASSISEALRTASPVKKAALSIDRRQIVLPLVPPDRITVVSRMQTSDRWLRQSGIPRSLEGEFRFQRDSARAVLHRFDRPPLTEKSTEVQAAVIGDVIIVANPGETFLSFGEQTTAALGGARVMVAGYTNDYVGYIPHPDRYVVDEQRQLSYPAYLTPWINGEFRFREDVGSVLVGQMVKLAHDVIQSSGSRR